MPLVWRHCELRGDGSFEGGHGAHPICLVYPHRYSGLNDDMWKWAMNGMPHTAKVLLLGWANTSEEAKKAAEEIFDVWLERSRLQQSS